MRQCAYRFLGFFTGVDLATKQVAFGHNGEAWLGVQVVDESLGKSPRICFFISTMARDMFGAALSNIASAVLRKDSIRTVTLLRLGRCLRPVVHSLPCPGEM